MTKNFVKVSKNDGKARQVEAVDVSVGAADAGKAALLNEDGLLDPSLFSETPTPSSSGGALIFPLITANPGEAVLGGNAYITDSVDLGVVGAGPAHLYQVKALAVLTDAVVSIPVMLRPGKTKLKPTGKFEGVTLTGTRLLAGSSITAAASNVPDWLADASFTAGSSASVDTKTLTHDDGGSFEFDIEVVEQPDILSVTRNTDPAGALTAFKPGDTVNLTVTAVADALIKKVYIGGTLIHTETTPANDVTFDWVVPAVATLGYDATLDFDIRAEYLGMSGDTTTFAIPVETSQISSLSNKTETYPSTQLALKGSESVTIAGRLNHPASGDYTFAAQLPAGFTLGSESYTPAGSGMTDYSVTFARSSSAQGFFTVSFEATSNRSAHTATQGTHQIEVQLNAPTLNLQLNRIRFGTGVNTISVRSNLRLLTPPTLTNFTYSAEVAAGANWDYSYTRSNITAPAGGENKGISGGAVNPVVVTVNARGRSGITQTTVGGTYSLYGWIGNFTWNFTTSYVKIAALTSLQQQGLYDAGTITATSNASDTPTWALCNSSGTVTALPAATHIKITNAEIENNSGTANLVLTST